jgi:hypothetical protein
MKARIKSTRLWPPLSLLKGERMEVRGSENSAEIKSANPHPGLSLRKGEADQRANANKEKPNALR